MHNPFAPTHTPEEAEPRRALSLFELNSMVRAVLQHTLAERYWVAAEVSELRVASNGHCYLEFVQKDDASGAIVAKARAQIWRDRYTLLSAHFERATGQPLAAGLKVMVAVSVTFHELYGYSLSVTDVDPTYTLGDVARRRREIIRQLEEDGVIGLNKEQKLPRVVRRVAVISSPTAAGYGDFCKQLEQSGYAFEIGLFAATMQGERVETSVIDALDEIAVDADRWDVVVIIRGGGATADLGGFDSYLLAANVAQFPLPVLTGIGHERDDTIIDLVAHTRLKTPTAVAAFLIDRRASETAALTDLQQRLVRAVEARLQAEQVRCAERAHRLQQAATQAVAVHRRTFDERAHRFELAAARYAARQRALLLRLAARLDVLATTRLQTAHRTLDEVTPRLGRAAERLFTHERHRQELLSRSLKLAGPDRILSLGFSITLKDGRAVRSAAELRPGDRLTTLLADGRAESTVLEAALNGAEAAAENLKAAPKEP